MSGQKELNTIRDEIKAFLKDREDIASITSERDLQNASTLHQVNQQTRATEMVTGQPQEKLAQKDEEAAGTCAIKRILIKTKRYYLHCTDKTPLVRRGLGGFVTNLELESLKTHKKATKGAIFIASLRSFKDHYTCTVGLGIRRDDRYVYEHS